MAFHTTWGRSDGPFPGENGDFESNRWGVEFVEGKAIPRELCGEEVPGERFDVAGEGGAEGNTGSVEEEESWDGEEDDEE